MTQQENVRRADQRRGGRQRLPIVRGTSSFCNRGHPWNEVNTRINAKGHRECRACRREREHEARKAARNSFDSAKELLDEPKPMQ